MKKPTKKPVKTGKKIGKKPVKTGSKPLNGPPFRPLPQGAPETT